MSEHIEDHKQLYEAARSLRATGMPLSWKADEISSVLDELIRLRHIVASGLAVSINQENKELRHEVDRLQSDNREMTKFKEHMVELREAHGFDSWAAALVEVDKLRAEVERVKSLNHQQFGDAIRKNAEVDAMKADHDEISKDAWRYRWLRDEADPADWEVLSHQLTREIDRRIDERINP